jgi:hypothetical protein
MRRLSRIGVGVGFRCFEWDDGRDGMVSPSCMLQIVHHIAAQVVQWALVSILAAAQQQLITGNLLIDQQPSRVSPSLPRLTALLAFLGE